MSSSAPVSKETESEKQDLQYCFFKSLNSMALVKTCMFVGLDKIAHDQIISSERYSEPCDTVLQQTLEDLFVERIKQVCIPSAYPKLLLDIGFDIARNVKQWIKYLSSFHRRQTDYNNVEHVEWLSTGAVDCVATARNIISRNPESVEDNYKLACLFCLEDIIVSLAPQVVSPNFLRHVTITKEPMVHFWTALFYGGDGVNMIEIINTYNRNFGTDVSTKNELLFNCLLHSNFDGVNAVPLKFMWDLLSPSEKKKNLVYALKGSSPCVFKCVLLNQLIPEELKEVLKSDTCTSILKTILFSSECDEYFHSTLLYVHKFINDLDFYSILTALNEELKHCSSTRNLKYASIFIEIWNLLPTFSKQTFFWKIICVVDWVKNFDIVKHVISFFSVMFRRYILHSCESQLKMLLKGGRCDLFEKYTVLALFSPSDLAILRNKMLQEEYDMMVYLVNNKRVNELDEHINWAFTTSNGYDAKEKKKFKNSLMLDSSYRLFMIADSDTVLLTQLFNWCDPNHETSTNFRKKFLDALPSNAELVLTFEKLVSAQERRKARTKKKRKLLSMKTSKIK